MPDCWDPSVSVGVQATQAGLGCEGGSCFAQLEGRNTGKETGEICVMLPFKCRFIGQCSSLKISGNFSFPFFDGDVLKQAVTDKNIL